MFVPSAVLPPVFNPEYRGEEGGVGGNGNLGTGLISLKTKSKENRRQLEHDQQLTFKNWEVTHISFVHEYFKDINDMNGVGFERF